MESRDVFHNFWSKGQPFQDGHSNPGHTTNGHYFSPYPPGQRTSNNRRPQPGQNHSGQYGSLYWPVQHLRENKQPRTSQSQNELYTTPFVANQQPSQLPTTGIGHRGGHSSFADNGSHESSYNNRDYITSGPIVHEGFIPAPGHEDDDDNVEAPYEYRNTLDQGIESDDERESEEEQEFLRQLAEKDDSSADSDFSMPDIDEAEDVDDMIDDLDEYEDEEPNSSRSNFRRRGRGRSKACGRGRGGRGGTRGFESTRGSRARTRGRRGIRQVADPGPQFKSLQKLANNAYLKGNLQETIEYAQRAIQLNPEIYASHSLLSEAYEKMGDKQKALEALLVGAPTKRDTNLWYYIIDQVRGMNPREYPLFSRRNKSQIVYGCLTEILNLDSTDFEARKWKFEIECEQRKNSKAVKNCRVLLAMRPYDSGLLQTLARLGTATPKLTRIHLERIIKTFDASIAYFVAKDQPSSSNLNWSLLNVYLELLESSKDFTGALHRLRVLSRWIQGRAEEVYWDKYQDDREFDSEDEPRRSDTPEFSRVSNRNKYGKVVPLEIRMKLGLLRLRQQPPNIGEAMRHLRMFQPQDNGPNAKIWDYGDLFVQIADALHSSAFDREALQFYEALNSRTPEWMSLKSYLGMHTCYKNLNQSENANALVPIFLNWEADSVKDIAILAKFFEDNGMEKEAMERGEIAYKRNGFRTLQNIGFDGLATIQAHFYKEKRKSQPNYRARKARIQKTMKTLKKVTMDAEDSDTNEIGATFIIDRPKAGLFRTKKSGTPRRSENFQPVESIEPETIAGTDVPISAVDSSEAFRRKLDELAMDYPDDLLAVRRQHRDILASFKRLEGITSAADDGDEVAMHEYLSIGRELIQEFSEFDLFFYNKKQQFRGYFRRVGKGDLWKDGAIMVLAVAANHAEDGEFTPELKEYPNRIPDEFFGVHFDKWFEMFMRYAIILSKEASASACFNTLELALQMNIFYWSQPYTYQLQSVRLACGIVLDDSMQVSTAIRWFMRTYPFGSDLFRLYGSANRLCSQPEGFASGSALKVLMRYIKAMDYALLNPQQRARYNFQGNDRTTWFTNAVSTGIIGNVRDHDPALFALFGHAMANGQNFITALNYYFRAYALTPDDPILNLSIGLAYLQHALKRLSENRQYQIQQGFSFIYRYYDLRTKDGVAAECSEAEFNLGRAWHSLGLANEAVPHYEQCITLSERAKREAKEDDARKELESAEDFATEAAFALQQVYALSGDLLSAKKVTEKVLVIN
ncbi:TPR-like protein [Lojkania enalia]|uniref:TPR-like protein n=1 Tax=Lojkania enalia TaxID=147567 RepID=A0A9P4N7Y7_9PLEO|nr:TPR-like protein [Didymosphaeria enalia]